MRRTPRAAAVIRHVRACAVLVLLVLALHASAPSGLAPLVDSTPYQVPAVGPRVDLVDYGAACDGTTDDRQAFVDALADLRTRGGGTLELPGRACVVRQGPDAEYLTVPSHVTIQGRGKASVVELTCEQADTYVELFRLNGESVALRDLHLVRASDCYGSMLALHTISGLTIDHVEVDGHSEQFAQTMHGIILQVVGTSRALLLDSVVLRRLDYGLFQPNGVDSALVGVTVRNSTFSQNRADDLELNAPAGSMQQVVVEDNTFRDNQSTTDGAGFGVGLANVQDARIVGNDFMGYSFEPVHIEDRSAHVSILRNRFRDSFTADRAYASHVFIVNGSSDVHISHNDFDASLNTNAMQAVFVNAGGEGFPDPQDIVVEDNQLTARSNVELVYSPGISGVLVRDNAVTVLD